MPSNKKSAVSTSGSTPLKAFRLEWQSITQSTAWLVQIVTAFLIPPPSDLSAKDNSVFKFSIFTIAFVSVLMSIPVLLYRKPKYTRRWVIVSVAAFILASIAFFTYRDLYAIWSVEFEQKRVAIGSESSLTPLGRKYRHEFPLTTNEQIVRFTAGRPEQMWQAASIHANAIWLSVVYVLCSTLFTVAVISMLQALKCSGNQGQSSLRPRP